MQDSVARSGDLQIDDGRRVAGTSRFLVGRMAHGGTIFVSRDVQWVAGGAR